MNKSIMIGKEADAKKGFLSTHKSDKSIHRIRDEHERQLGSLGSVIGNIGRDGTALSAESIATELGGMSAAERTPALLALQQTHGNRYVQRVVAGIQAKLVVGQPGDIYEQEADRVADAVMRMPEPQVQRQIEPEEEEEETLQSKPLASQITHLVQVQRQEEPKEEEEETLNAKPLTEEITPLVQRQVEPEEEEEELQEKATSSHPSEVNSNLESQIQSLKGGGQPLSETDRAFFEPRFGRDFSQVRVHTDATVDRLAKKIGARAFTTGRDIFFREGAYGPRSETGMKLLSHELTHVVQQRAPFGNKNFNLDTIQLSPKVGPTVEPELSPKKVKTAVKLNKKFAKELGWGKKYDLFKTLERMPPSTVNKLRDLWVGKEYRKFAQLVARFQFYILHFKGRDIDGVIGSRTWDLVLLPGELVALGRRLWQEFPAGVTVAFYDRHEPVAVRRAKEWATRERAISTKRKPISAKNLVFGKAFPDSYDIKTTLPALGKVLTAASAKAGKPGGVQPLPGTGPSRIRVLAIFSHGTTGWLGIGKGITSRKAKPLIKSIAPALTTDVNVVLYACSAARSPSKREDWHKGTFKPGGAKSLAGVIRDALLKEGMKQAKVWGHTTVGHMTRNFALRIFYAAHGKNQPGEAYAGTCLGTLEEVLALFDLEDEIANKGYAIPPKIAVAFRREAYRRLSGGVHSLFYKCYAEANKKLKYRGANLAEMAPVDPQGVADVIENYWKNTFWPKKKPALADQLIRKFKFKKP